MTVFQTMKHNSIRDFITIFKRHMKQMFAYEIKELNNK